MRIVVVTAPPLEVDIVEMVNTSVAFPTFPSIEREIAGKISPEAEPRTREITSRAACTCTFSGARDAALVWKMAAIATTRKVNVADIEIFTNCK